jgi:F0F1-type ATP synthase assembly protein I
MVGKSLTIKKAVFVLIAVAVVAVVAGVLTAKYIGNFGLMLIALAAGFGGFLLYVYASSEARKAIRPSESQSAETDQTETPSPKQK